MTHQLIVRQLGLTEYVPVWHAMQAYTRARCDKSNDEIWLVEHPPVFTQGQAGKAEHLLATGDIPVVQVDRGGQVTYHGPGQLVAYLLVDLNRLQLHVRSLVDLIESSIISLLLNVYGLEAQANLKAPGVYVNSAKLASLGLRVRKGCSYHGLALNVNMDLEPFNRINPCGYAGLTVTQLASLLPDSVLPTVETVGNQLLEQIAAKLGYNLVNATSENEFLDKYLNTDIT